jgi:hypothetical protein
MKFPGARWRRHCSSFVFLTILGPLHAQTSSAAVTGTVVDDAGNPVAAARVLISHAVPANGPHFPAPPTITGHLTATIVSDGNGNFTATNLPAGQYVMCAEVTTQGLLDPCHWAVSAPSFTLTDGQPVSGLKIVMAKGAVLTVHLDDPDGLLNKSVAGPVDFDCAVHVVTSKGIHQFAAIQANNARGRDHVITIPYGTPVTLKVVTAHLTITDKSGGPVPAQASITAAPGATLAINYTIKGKK